MFKLKRTFGKFAAIFLAAASIYMCPLSAEASTLKTENSIRYIQYDSGETKPYTGWTTRAGKRYLQKWNFKEKLLAYRER